MPITLDNITLESGLTITTPPSPNFGNNIIFYYLSMLLQSSCNLDLINWRAETGYTLEYWFNYSFFNSAFINKSIGNMNGFNEWNWYFGVVNDGSIEFKTSTGTDLLTAPGLVTTGTWHNIALVCTTVSNVTTVNIYVDGILQAVTTTSDGTLDTNMGFGYGAQTSGGGIYTNNTRISNIARYSGSSYTLADSAFTPDANTLLLLVPTELPGALITSYQDSGAGGVLTQNSNDIIATAIHANHT
jgi:hypothetical protein